MLKKPEGAGLFSEGRSGDANHLQQPFVNLGLMQMQPVETPMDGGESRKAGDALMGRSRHVLL